MPHGTQSGTFTVRWCENTSGGDDCWHVERLGIHEFGHILDLGHNGSSVENTIMQASTPAYSSTDKLKRCDKARLQLKYDVPTPYSGYADCFDHITGGGGDGLLTSASIGASDTSVCQGDTVRFDGRLKVRNDYGLLADNALAGRTVQLQRSASSGGPFSDSGTGAGTDLDGDWQRTYSYPGEASWWFRARFYGETGLQGEGGNPVRVNWSDC